MKLFIIASLLVSGGGVAMFSDNDITEDVKDDSDKFVQGFKHKGNKLTDIKESGLEYPPTKFLENFTEEEATIILSTIDQINAEYDFSTMTDFELKDALSDIKLELEELYEAYGFVKEDHEMKYNMKHNMHRHNIEEHIETIKESGIPYPNENFSNMLTDIQLEEITTTIDGFNSLYDFSEMTDEEIRETLGSINQELKDLYSDLKLFPKTPHK